MRPYGCGCDPPLRRRGSAFQACCCWSAAFPQRLRAFWGEVQWENDGENLLPGPGGRGVLRADLISIAQAQETINQATISGRVLDAQGAAVPGAR